MTIRELPVGNRHGLGAGSLFSRLRPEEWGYPIETTTRAATPVNDRH